MPSLGALPCNARAAAFAPFREYCPSECRIFSLKADGLARNNNPALDKTGSLPNPNLR